MTKLITIEGDGYEIDFVGHYTQKCDHVNADFETVFAGFEGKNILPLLIEHGLLNDYEQQILVELLP